MVRPFRISQKSSKKDIKIAPKKIYLDTSMDMPMSISANVVVLPTTSNETAENVGGHVSL